MGAFLPLIYIRYLRIWSTSVLVSLGCLTIYRYNLEGTNNQLKRRKYIV